MGSIGQAAKLAGVSVETLWEWEKMGKISSHRTQGGHRRYDVLNPKEESTFEEDLACDVWDNGLRRLRKNRLCIE